MAYYNDNLIVSLKDSTITHHKQLLRDKDDLFMPVLWRAGREYMAYSVKGYESKVWQLPTDWSDVHSVDIYKITSSGIFYKTSIACEDGYIRFSLEPDEAVSIFPSTGQYKSEL